MSRNDMVELVEPMNVVARVAAWEGLGLGSVVAGGVIALSLPAAHGPWLMTLSVFGWLAATAKAAYVSFKRIDETAKDLENHKVVTGIEVKAIRDTVGDLRESVTDLRDVVGEVRRQNERILSILLEHPHRHRRVADDHDRPLQLDRPPVQRPEQTP